MDPSTEQTDENWHEGCHVMTRSLDWTPQFTSRTCRPLILKWCCSWCPCLSAIVALAFSITSFRLCTSFACRQKRSASCQHSFSDFHWNVFNAWHLNKHDSIFDHLHCCSIFLKIVTKSFYEASTAWVVQRPSLPAIGCAQSVLMRDSQGRDSFTKDTLLSTSD